MFLDNWQLILYTSLVNIVVFYLIFDSNLVNRSQEETSISGLGSQSVFNRYATVAFYSVILAILMWFLVSIEKVVNGSTYALIMIIGLQLLAFHLHIPDLDTDQSKSRRVRLFTFLSAFSAFTLAVFLS